ncbi:ribosomal protein S18-alanine N-acetyltransferase [Pseudorhodoferax sp.]|uniref:ribosomal protein S18-alanine N-acetyltransferase n=1 Tax=Pseudorhodoferax sp. TaxID=1993553 RepID=UPI0039E3CE2A
MSARPVAPAEASFEPLTEAWLPAVLRIEQQAYTHPWTLRNFQDALSAGYQAQGLVADGELLGYFIAMKGVDEVHLLNITVSPAYQRQGLAWLMLDALALWSRGQRAQWLWLEVRVSNLRAARIYAAFGFRRVGLRKGYYPDAGQRREDAIVMSLAL